jgi:hypothetical protein
MKRENLLARLLRRWPSSPAASWPSCIGAATTRVSGLPYEPDLQRPSGSIPQPMSPCDWGAGAGTHRPLGSIPQPSLVMGAVFQTESKRVRSEPSKLEGAARDEATARAKRALRMGWDLRCRSPRSHSGSRVCTLPHPRCDGLGGTGASVGRWGLPWEMGSGYRCGSGPSPRRQPPQELRRRIQTQPDPRKVPANPRRSRQSAPQER